TAHEAHRAQRQSQAAQKPEAAFYVAQHFLFHYRDSMSLAIRESAKVRTGSQQGARLSAAHPGWRNSLEQRLQRFRERLILRERIVELRGDAEQTLRRRRPRNDGNFNPVCVT